MNIYEINEKFDELNKDKIDAIIKDINDLIELNVNEQKQVCYYKTDSVTDEISNVEANRIIDSVIYYFRKRGVRIIIVPKSLSDEIDDLINHNPDNFVLQNGFYYGFFESYGVLSGSIGFKSFNILSGNNYILQIKLNYRLANEYMKTYC